MSKQNIWVARHPTANWQVKSEGAARAHSLHHTQAEAKQVARQIAQRRECELKIQGKNGRIVNSNTYAAHDPCPPKDTKR